MIELPSNPQAPHPFKFGAETENVPPPLANPLSAATALLAPERNFGGGNVAAEGEL